MRGRPSDPLPDFIDPQLATLVQRPPEGDAWLHEVKIDGYRVAARVERGKVRMLTRHGNDWTPRFRPIAAILADLPIKAAYLDGEIAVLTAEGVSDFGALQEALGRRGGSREMAFIVFDILHLDGRDLRPLPLIERKTILEKVLARVPVRSPVQFSADVTGKGGKVRPGMQAALGGDHIEAGERPLQIRSRFQLAEGEVHLAPGIHDWRLQARDHRSPESRVGAHRLLRPRAPDLCRVRRRRLVCPARSIDYGGAPADRQGGLAIRRRAEAGCQGCAMDGAQARL